MLCCKFFIRRQSICSTGGLVDSRCPHCPTVDGISPFLYTATVDLWYKWSCRQSMLTLICVKVFVLCLCCFFVLFMEHTTHTIVDLSTFRHGRRHLRTTWITPSMCYVCGQTTPHLGRYSLNWQKNKKDKKHRQSTVTAESGPFRQLRGRCMQFGDSR